MNRYINPLSKLFNHLDRLADIKAGKRPAPVNVEIDTSWRCSLGCVFCHFAHTHTRGPLATDDKPADFVSGGDLIETNLAKSIIDQLQDFGVRSITWSGGGEPTLHPDFDELIDYTSVDQGLYTHGGHISIKRAKLLVRKMKWVYVSLDESNGLDYAKYKGVTPERFEAACLGISNLVQAKKEAEQGATVGIGFLLRKESYKPLIKKISLMQRLGADYCQFRPTILYDHSKPGARIENTIWIDDCLKSLAMAKVIPNIEVDLERFKMYRDWTGHPYHTCWWSAIQTVITPNGKVWTCLNKRGQQGAELGDLSQEHFADIWQRSKAACVDGDCRVMCRGHIPNLALDQMMVAQTEHVNFI